MFFFYHFYSTVSRLPLLKRITARGKSIIFDKIATPNEYIGGTKEMPIKENRKKSIKYSIGLNKLIVFQGSDKLLKG